MRNENGVRKTDAIASYVTARDRSTHPAWSAFIRYCTELEHGEIETLKIQNGLPVLAEVARKKVRFPP